MAQQAQQDVGAGQKHHDDDCSAGQGVEAGADPGDFSLNALHRIRSRYL
jgi:hypothetical protein